ncbi:DUF4838 domain-containing protein [Anatilimnocola floriformis]|uniref:DUF4838 domain-containing protein n=1 Tax=Anatilimnocola floriformis TaxID=2948575 RepID=UPI0020C5810B|nr:DUF4838 domain-containing protein [Anatilimnocola floriformis]
MRSFMLLLLLFPLSSFAATAGKAGKADLVIATGGKSAAIVLVAPDAGAWEKRAAEDLVTYIERLSGGKPALANTKEAIDSALKHTGPQLLVGRLALEQKAALRDRLVASAKKKPLLRADAVVRQRDGNRVYLAGNNDDAHYYAVVMLLNEWGCRWYLPTELGECIPRHSELLVGDLDEAYGSPFEVRRYWLSWNGSNDGQAEFSHRNFFNELLVPNGHNLAQYTKDLIPPGKTMFNVPIAEDKTADHVAKQVAPMFAQGKDVQLGMEDGLYSSDSPLDKELMALQYDKHFLMPSATDAFLTFYNKVAERLLKESPNSASRIGFLAYANITLPPVRVQKAARPLVAYLAPIDIDPIHAMNSPLSAPRREYKEILKKWSEVMDGRVVIYDYDQGMMVWRDIPAPSVQMFRHDVKEYQQAGILGVDTESRGAFATIFTNLFYRGQLLWNPEANVDALEKQFYADFFGPAAEPMQAYWTAINKAWAESIVTEHEYHVIPAIYTPELVQQLGKWIDEASKQAAAAEAEKKPWDKVYLQRLAFMRDSYQVTAEYTAMIRAANTEVDYPAAARHGENALAARERLTALSGTLTTYKVIGEHGAAWFPGEVEQYRKLAKLTGGDGGTLVQKLPLQWLFRTDSQKVGVDQNWATAAIDLPAQPTGTVDWHDVQKSQDKWQWLRTDVYAQAQGVVTADHQSYTGQAWYRTEIDLPADKAGAKLQLMFPGLFNEGWLYINGEQVAHRENYNPVWWYNAYEFEWDVPVAGKLKEGKNTIALRINNPHHMGGMFRRPFLYAK